MSKHQVQITTEHIENGIPGNTAGCPAALALKKSRGQGPRFQNVQVGFRTTTLAHELFSMTDLYVHTQEFTDRIHDYDQARKKNTHPQLNPGLATLVIDTESARIDLFRNPAAREHGKIRETDQEVQEPTDRPGKAA